MSNIKEYPEITQYGYINDGNVFLKGYWDLPDREIGVVRESDEASLNYFIERFYRVEEKLTAVEEAVNANDNKGSYLMKLIHMRTYLTTYNGLGDFVGLYQKIDDLEASINDYIQVNREKNSNIKRALLDEAEQLQHSTNWKFSSIKMKELKIKWIKTGSAYKEQEDEMAVAFNAAIEYFFDRRQEYYTEQNLIMDERLEQYKNMIDELRRINRESNPPAFIPRIKTIQRDWKNVGRVNKIKFKKLSSDFKREVDKFFYTIKLHKVVKYIVEG